MGGKVRGRKRNGGSDKVGRTPELLLLAIRSFALSCLFLALCRLAEDVKPPMPKNYTDD